MEKNLTPENEQANLDKRVNSLYGRFFDAIGKEKKRIAARLTKLIEKQITYLEDEEFYCGCPHIDPFTIFARIAERDYIKSFSV